MKSFWFKRFKKEAESLSPHLRFIPLKLGFWRIYWKDHYITECYEEMGFMGYDLTTYDPRIESQSYYEEYELHNELVRRVKNYVEGYYDSITNLKTRLYMLLHDKEFFERSQNVYKNVVVK